ncbi:hypothetical protein GGI35DRAFT_452915 [Trichoderma velutinum]
MYLSTLLPCIVALASTVVNAQTPQTVVLYNKPAFTGDSWAFTGDPYACTKVGDIVFGKVSSVSLALATTPAGFYCSLYGSVDCAASGKVSDVAVLIPKIPLLSNTDVQAIQCHSWPGRV